MKALLATLSILIIVCTLNRFALLEESRNECGRCITSGPEHAYCMMENFSLDGNRPRCDSKYNLLKAGCVENEIYRPQPEYTLLEDLPFSNETSEDDDVVQLRPQRIKLRLPPHMPHTITLQYKQVVAYPVDLYYLMDLSNSMRDDKTKLAELGNQLEANMKHLTKNFMLGFGSFVDKVAMPYVSTVPEKLKNPCPEGVCAAPYGFRNHMPLNKDTSGFTRQVAESQISGNLDAPEGGLDAVMQAIVCPEINWRTKSRKMLVYTTDAGFHYAGDGKLAGIVTPNDGECHLRDGEYEMSTEQDYPSISQINQKAQEHHVNIIFAATENQVKIYQKLTPLIEGSSSAKLMNDSSNIVDLIAQQYRDITSEIELKDNATSHVQLTYHSSCVNDKRKETNACKGLKVGSTVTFDIDVEVKSCPKRRSDFTQTIQIYPVGLNETLFIDLEMVCECDCEKPDRIEEHSPKCSGFGTFVCGKCECDPFRYGRTCACDAKESDPTKDQLGCYRGNDTRVCSGRGVCPCGVCECIQRKNDPDARIYGKHCECDNFSCFHHDNKICSGPDHGTCECGVCQCNKDWTGPACECRKSVDTCIDPKSGKICAGHGECICGECKCLSTEDRQYTGRYCEECPTCPTLCEQYKDCVRCTVFGTGPKTIEECALCKNSTFNIEKVTKLDEIQQDETLCVFIDDDDCRYQFKYKLIPRENGEETIIHASDQKECPTPIPIFLILLALALLILLLGLLGLLLWKCLTMWKDRRETARLEKEKLSPAWAPENNPIFKGATSTFKNPTYKH